MRPEAPSAPIADATSWRDARTALQQAGAALAVAPAGIARQACYDRYLTAQDTCTALVHTWLAEMLELDRVKEPRMVLSLDVDGVLEDEEDGYSTTGVAGAAALRLLQRADVAVLLNTGRSGSAVRARTEHLRLLGGVGAFGGTIWDGVFGQEHSLLSDRGQTQLTQLRSIIHADADIVQDRRYLHSVRAAWFADGELRPISGPDARRLLDQHGLSDLSFWVASRHTDFVDRAVDKSVGLNRLLEALGLTSLPLAAIGDAACDVPVLRKSAFAFLPAGSLPSYVAPRRQHLTRSRYLGDQSLWEAACRLVADSGLERSVTAAVARITYPAWFPQAIDQRLATGTGPIRRLARGVIPRRLPG